ncbi:hypothetical protein [Rhodanobacter sp. DHB23]|uniref:hypothetical protein n=1 Tax=Rhodanobacter sp. DHB23 TaxID=2775923 RepID=UPI0021028A5C|nr:hypothetical protein [Rhodanobacter sp. DHB23]
MNEALERGINRDPYSALKGMPAGHYGNAGKMLKAMDLGVIAGGTQAWCDNLPQHTAGCFITIYVQWKRNITPHLWDENDRCGSLIQWKAPLSTPSKYAPDSPGANLIAQGNATVLSWKVNGDWDRCHSD